MPTQKKKTVSSKSKEKITLGVIGGSGLYRMQDLRIVRREKVKTPFGPPSDPIVIGEIGGCRLAFLPRHGTGHYIPPSEINFRANIYALKKLGVERILSVSAVGSMKEEIVPGHIVIPNQFIDLTRRRIGTFYSTGLVGHTSLADPVCGELSAVAAASAKGAGATVHEGGTYVCIEGPQFSTRAESLLYRQWGVDIIGMTNVTEAKLAREVGICYATIALSTDYDCWHEGEEAVTLDAVLEVMHKNVAMAQKIICSAVAPLQTPRACSCGEAPRHAIVTDRKAVPAALRKKLQVLFGESL